MAAAERILLVEDDPRLSELTSTQLRRHGYEVDVAFTGADAIAIAQTRPPDLALLDFELPDMDGLEVLDAFKGGLDRPLFPVCFLTGARFGAGDQVLGLDRGASDYIPKGTDAQVLLARIRVAIRDRKAPAGALRRGDLRVDPVTNEAWLGARRLDLDRKPLLVLYHLVRRPGQVMTREELLRVVWNSEYSGWDRSIDQAVHVIRKELGTHAWVQTVRGVGYRFVDANAT